jgi:hypothetical protein
VSPRKQVPSLPTGEPPGNFLTLGPPEGEIIKKSLHVLTTPLSLRDISPEGAKNTLILMMITLKWKIFSPC